METCQVWAIAPTGMVGLIEANTNDVSSDVTNLNEIPGPALLLPDFYLSSGSDSISKVPPLAWVAADIDGDRRPVGLLSDAGADEYLRHRSA